MPTKLHFINVGQGNMTLVKLDDGQTYLYDCNVTNDNEDDVLGYVSEQIGKGTKINAFICSHRDADHMRGVKKVHAKFPIQKVWDTGVVGTTTNSQEYKEYMALRRDVGYTEIESHSVGNYKNTRLRIMNSKNDDLADNGNAQSMVIKVVHRDMDRDFDCASVLLAGDTDAASWKHIRKHYSDTDLSCSLLLASHHGSLRYFKDPCDEEHYYIGHLKAKSPAMTIISVGKNAHGHPDEKALEFYEKYSTGSKQGYKVFRTNTQGHMSVELQDGGGWSLAKQN